MEQENDTIESNEIDLIELSKKIWSQKILLLKITSITVVLGLIIAFTTPKEYTSESTFMLENISSGKYNFGGSLNGLASLAGLDFKGLSTSSSGWNPKLFETILKSPPHMLSLIHKEFYFSEINDTISLFDYFNHYSETSLLSNIFSLPNRIISWINPVNWINSRKKSKEAVHNIFLENDFLIITREEYGIIQVMRSRISLEIDDGLQTILISSEMPTPRMAALVNHWTVESIEYYVNTYTQNKNKEQLLFVTKQCEESERKFRKIQSQLALFRDRNQNIITAKVQVEEQRIQSDYDIAFNVYNQLSIEKEKLQVQINKSNPIFTIINPPMMPLGASKPKKTIILMVSMLLGIIFGLVIVSVKLYLKHE